MRRVILLVLAAALLGGLTLIVLATPGEKEIALAPAPVPQARAHSGVAAKAFNTPQRNPWLADGPYPISHHNPGQTDVSTEHGATRGKDLTVSESHTVPVTWCSAPIVKKVGAETTVIAGAANALVKIRATGENFEHVSTLYYPAWNDHSDVTPEVIHDVMSGIDESRRAGDDTSLLLRSLGMFVSFELWGMPNGAYGAIDRDGYHYTAPAYPNSSAVRRE